MRVWRALTERVPRTTTGTTTPAYHDGDLWWGFGNDVDFFYDTYTGNMTVTFYTDGQQLWYPKVSYTWWDSFGFSWEALTYPNTPAVFPTRWAPLPGGGGPAPSP